MSIFHITLIVLTIQAMVCLHDEKCPQLTLNNITNNGLSIAENTFATVTFGIDSTTCNQPNTTYTITAGTRTVTGSLEYDGLVMFYSTDMCGAREGTSVRCITRTGPAEIKRKVNRTHVKMEWELTWKDAETGRFITKQKELMLNVLYPPSVTNLTINGHEAYGKQLINKGQINISCFFDKGNPPSDLLLLDGKGTEMNVHREDNYLNYSLTVHCKDDWPTLRCERNGSERNRSVSFLVRCRLLFLDMYPKVTNDTSLEKWMFNVRAHTTEIQICLLTSLPLEKNSNKEVNCTLTGDPPDLLLIVELDKERDAKGQTWALSLRNDIGFSDTLVFTTPFRQGCEVDLYLGSSGSRNTKTTKTLSYKCNLLQLCFTCDRIEKKG